MKIIKKSILLLLLLIFVTGCSSKQNEEAIKEDSSIEETVITEESEKPSIPKCRATTDMEVYSESSTDSLLRGYVKDGDFFEIYETDGTWCRIGDTFWINNVESTLEKIPDDTDMNIKYDKDTFFDVVYYGRQIDGMYIKNDREKAESVENKYDDNGRLASETLRIFHENSYFGDYYENEVIQYSYDSSGNIIEEKIDSYKDDGTHMMNLLHRFTYNEKDMLITEADLADSGEPFATYTRYYDDLGNLVGVKRENTENHNHDSYQIYEGNGNIRFSYIDKQNSNDDEEASTYLYRYDSDGNIIEECFAFMGDIRNGGYK